MIVDCDSRSTGLKMVQSEEYTYNIHMHISKHKHYDVACGSDEVGYHGVSVTTTLIDHKDCASMYLCC